MVLRKVERLASGMRILKPLPDDDIPGTVMVVCVNAGRNPGMLSVVFVGHKQEAVEMYPDDLVQVII